MTETLHNISDIYFPAKLDLKVGHKNKWPEQDFQFPEFFRYVCILYVTYTIFCFSLTIMPCFSTQVLKKNLPR